MIKRSADRKALQAANRHDDLDHDNFYLEWFGTEEGGKEAKVVTLSHKRKK